MKHKLTIIWNNNNPEETEVKIFDSKEDMNRFIFASWLSGRCPDKSFQEVLN